VVELSEGRVEFLLRELLLTAHFLERVDTHAIAFSLVEITATIGIIIAPESFNCVHNELLIFVHLTFFLLGVWLCVNGFLFRIRHDHRRLNWVVGDILMLVTITDVKLAPLALPEVREGTRPDGGLDDNNTVLFASVVGVGHGIGHLVAETAKDPSWIVTLASLVCCDGLETWLIRICADDAVNLGVAIFNLLSDRVACLIVS